MQHEEYVNKRIYVTFFTSYRKLNNKDRETKTKEERQRLANIKWIDL